MSGVGVAAAFVAVGVAAVAARTRVVGIGSAGKLAIQKNSCPSCRRAAGTADIAVGEGTGTPRQQAVEIHKARFPPVPVPVPAKSRGSVSPNAHSWLHPVTYL